MISFSERNESRGFAHLVIKENTATIELDLKKITDEEYTKWKKDNFEGQEPNLVFPIYKILS